MTLSKSETPTNKNERVVGTLVAACQIILHIKTFQQHNYELFDYFKCRHEIIYLSPCLIIQKFQ